MKPADSEERQDAIERTAKAMNAAVPDDTESGIVMAALCILLQYGIDNAPPEIKSSSCREILRVFTEKLQQVRHGHH